MSTLMHVAFVEIRGELLHVYLDESLHHILKVTSRRSGVDEVLPIQETSSGAPYVELRTPPELLLVHLHKDALKDIANPQFIDDRPYQYR